MLPTRPDKTAPLNEALRYQNIPDSNFWVDDVDVDDDDPIYTGISPRTTPTIITKKATITTIATITPADILI